ncbi:craniofacial development protein 2-like [Plakobranchus ocellatus]|uniref:Craniofacial development protein 2-like n=1 Tax=Plakobranchus ocellatus TaxID=259542 RepID=A0AAV3YQJ5_9GAST|nr:craniofacial development protein 2-like [Plakobranchus ocellatus]
MILPSQILSSKNYPRRQWTWKSPEDKSRNKIDYILIQKRFRNAVKTSKSLPGADYDSDHIPHKQKQRPITRGQSSQTSEPPSKINKQIETEKTLQTNHLKQIGLISTKAVAEVTSQADHLGQVDPTRTKAVAGTDRRYRLINQDR